MTQDILIWSTAAQCWRTVRLAGPRGTIRFDPLDGPMTEELARRAFIHGRDAPGKAVRALFPGQPAVGWD